MAAGHATVKSIITEEHEHVTFGVVHLGDHVFNGGVRTFRDDEAYRSLADELMAAASTSDVAAAIRTLDRHFGPLVYSLQSLFYDQRTAILLVRVVICSGGRSLMSNRSLLAARRLVPPQAIWALRPTATNGRPGTIKPTA